MCAFRFGEEDEDRSKDQPWLQLASATFQHMRSHR